MSASQSTLADAISTDLNRSQQISTDLNRSQQISTDLNRSQQISVFFSGQLLLMNQDDLLSEYIKVHKVPSKRIVGGIFVVPRLVQGITSMLEDFRCLHASAASVCGMICKRACRARWARQFAGHQSKGLHQVGPLVRQFNEAICSAWPIRILPDPSRRPPKQSNHCSLRRMEACEQRCHLLAQHVLAPEIALAEAEDMLRQKDCRCWLR